jgi:hypothetical protein
LLHKIGTSTSGNKYSISSKGSDKNQQEKLLDVHLKLNRGKGKVGNVEAILKIKHSLFPVLEIKKNNYCI